MSVGTLPLKIKKAPASESDSISQPHLILFQSKGSYPAEDEKCRPPDTEVELARSTSYNSSTSEYHRNRMRELGLDWLKGSDSMR